MKTTKRKKAGAVEPMVGPSARTIKRRLKELREMIDNSKDPVEQRIAYTMETAIVWATQKTVGWEAPVLTARDLAVMLRRELGV